MPLLYQPAPSDVDGPMGYLARVAADNELSLSTILGLVESGELDDPFSLLELAPASSIIWRRKWTPFCPSCLRAHKYWRLGWEIRFADACAGCGRHLVDRCPKCRGGLTWKRPDLLSCNRCHADLSQVSTPYASKSSIALSRALEARARGRQQLEVPLLNGLSVEQCVRLIRSVGSPATWELSVSTVSRNVADELSASLPISTLAEELLSGWPSEFHRKLQECADAGAAGHGFSLHRTFGRALRQVYVVLGESEFDFLRKALEAFIASTWTGYVGRKQRQRFADSTLGAMAWVSTKVAQRDFAITRAELDRAIGRRDIAAVERKTARGRTFITVRRSDLESWVHSHPYEVDLRTAARRLHLERHRLAGLLPRLCPDAFKSAPHGAQWRVPNTWIDSWARRLSKLTAVDLKHHPGWKSLEELARFGPLSEGEITEVLEAIQRGDITPAGRVHDVQGLNGMVVTGEVIEGWLSKRRRTFSVVETSEILGIKQEVAYSLVRSGLIKCAVHSHRRTQAARVREEDIQSFRDNFVFARDLARTWDMSSIRVVKCLRDRGVAQASGPEADGSRQVVYARAAIAQVEHLFR